MSSIAAVRSFLPDRVRHNIGFQTFHIHVIKVFPPFSGYAGRVVQVPFIYFFDKCGITAVKVGWSGRAHRFFMFLQEFCLLVPGFVGSFSVSYTKSSHII